MKCNFSDLKSIHDLPYVLFIIEKFSTLEAYGRRDLIKQFIKDEILSDGNYAYALIYISKIDLSDQFGWHKFVKDYVSTLVNFS